VTIIEADDQILPQYDSGLTKPIAARLEALGVDVRLKTFASSMSDDGDHLIWQTKDGATEELPADLVLVTVGRVPLTEV